MEKKKRLFYLDFVRAIAVLMILLCHYNARYTIFYMSTPHYEKALGGWFGILPFHRSGGDLGVCLFFMISGCALMYVYKERLALKDYFKKRFLSLYPMFWIAYFFGFLYLFVKNQEMYHMDVPKPYFLLTILGMDGFSIGYLPNFYVLGEWFLGCIIIYYLIFPLLRKLLLLSPRIFAAFLLVFYVLYEVLMYFFTLPFNHLCLMWLPMFGLGMLFARCVKRIHPIALVISVALLTAFYFTGFDWMTYAMQDYLVGVPLFLVLAHVADHLAFRPVRWACGILSKYSYAIFLVHHIIIDQLCDRFDMLALNNSGNLLLFLSCMVLTGFFAKVLYEIHASMVRTLRNTPRKGEA